MRLVGTLISNITIKGEWIRRKDNVEVFTGLRIENGSENVILIHAVVLPWCSCLTSFINFATSGEPHDLNLS